MIDNIKTEAFVNIIRDADIKPAVYAKQKATLDTVAFALAQENARSISRPSVSKERTTEVVEEGECLFSKINCSHS